MYLEPKKIMTIHFSQIFFLIDNFYRRDSIEFLRKCFVTRKTKILLTPQIHLMDEEFIRWKDLKIYLLCSGGGGGDGVFVSHYCMTWLFLYRKKALANSKIFFPLHLTGWLVGKSWFMKHYHISMCVCVCMYVSCSKWSSPKNEWNENENESGIIISSYTNTYTFITI